MSTRTEPVIVLFAPTAAGKTALTRELFSPAGSHFILKAEIISADSQAVYKGMDIGTAKPSAQLRAVLPHHLIDIITPDMQYNVSDFVSAADDLCAGITGRGCMPVICGGTGFYIRNFLFGVPQTPASDEDVRGRLKKRIETEGKQKLYDELAKIDPESAAKIHPNDAYRICRALEVYYLCGRTRTSFSAAQKLRGRYSFLFILLEPPRDILYKRIEERVNQMFADGLGDEVARLRAAGYTKDSPGMKAIGYKEWFEHEDEAEVRRAIIRNSRKYAKKQFTYIRDIPGGAVIPFENLEKGMQKVIDVITDFCDNKNTL